MEYGVVNGEREWGAEGDPCSGCPEFCPAGSPSLFVTDLPEQREAKMKLSSSFHTQDPPSLCSAQSVC